MCVSFIDTKLILPSLWTIIKAPSSAAALFAPVMPTLQFESLSIISALNISRMDLGSGFTSTPKFFDAIWAICCIFKCAAGPIGWDGP